MNEYLIESPLSRLIFGFIAQVPLAKDSGGESGRLEDLSNRGGLQAHAFPFKNGMGDAVLELVLSGKQGAAGGCARRTDVEIREPHTFPMQTIQIGCFQDGISVARQITIALVIGQQENDVGLFIAERLSGTDRGNQQRPGN